jgi:exonuclease III
MLLHDKENIYNARWHGSNYHCFSTSTHSRGVSILFQKNLHFTVHSVHKSDDGRMLLINMEYEQNIITLVNIYAPNSENERCKFFKKLASWTSQYCLNEENILAGDFTSSHKAKNQML